MRAVVQRVASARVDVGDERTGEIGRGLLVYLGIGRDDTAADRAYVLRKVVGLRIFPDAAGKMSLAVRDVAGSLLIVSQFTLFGDVRKGQRPGFDDAMPSATARGVFDAFVREASVLLPVETGRFGADMKVTSVNDGPVTLWLDSAAQRDTSPRPP